MRNIQLSRAQVRGEQLKEVHSDFILGGGHFQCNRDTCYCNTVSGVLWIEEAFQCTLFHSRWPSLNKLVVMINSICMSCFCQTAG